MKKISLMLICSFFVSTTINAEHSWSTYHWARTGNPMQLTVIDSTNGSWGTHLSIAITDWDDNHFGYLDALDFSVVTGDTSKKTRRQCKAPSGQIRICNDS